MTVKELIMLLWECNWEAEVNLDLKPHRNIIMPAKSIINDPQVVSISPNTTKVDDDCTAQMR